MYPTSTTSDGGVLFSGSGRTGIWDVSLHDDHATAPVLQAPVDANYGDVSPDGRWLAYQSKTSGEPEVYLTRIPGPGAVIPVSVGGGRYPRWSADGSALFYRSGNGIVTVSVLGNGTSVRVGPPKTIIRGDYLGSVVGSAGYDVAPDGRFLMLKGIGSQGAHGDTSAHTMVMVRNWIQGLK